MLFWIAAVLVWLRSAHVKLSIFYFLISDLSLSCSQTGLRRHSSNTSLYKPPPPHIFFLQNTDFVKFVGTFSLLFTLNSKKIHRMHNDCYIIILGVVMCQCFNLLTMKYEVKPLSYNKLITSHQCEITLSHMEETEKSYKGLCIWKITLQYDYILLITSSQKQASKGLCSWEIDLKLLVYNA